jgi:hypothetical protein
VAVQIEVFPIPDIEISCAEPTWDSSSYANCARSIAF